MRTGLCIRGRPQTWWNAGAIGVPTKGGEGVPERGDGFGLSTRAGSA